MPHHDNTHRALKPRHLALALLAAIACLPAARADDTADNAPQPFDLGRVVVQGKRTTPPPAGESVVSRKQMDDLNRETVSDAVAILPGVNLSTNSRNESMVYVRGFDPRQVPVFLDGIPQYVPYDGYVDFARFTTFDLGEIRVAKGGASLLYGPNTLGGAINLVSRKPTRPVEGDVRVGVGSGGAQEAAVNLGLRRGDWYLQSGWSQSSASSFPLPAGFKDYKIKPTDTGDDRANADHDDRRVSVKVGYAPSDRNEFAIGYMRQDGQKGNPVYTGLASSGIRYWRWPYWDKDSLYFIGNIGIGQSGNLKLRAYDDHYGNGLDAYTDATYTVPINNTSFPSYYADATRGYSAEYSTTALANNDFHVAFHYKDDRHRETNPSSPDKRYRDVTTSLAVEDTMALGNAWHLQLGASHEQRDARLVYFWPTGKTSATNWVVELQRNVGEHGQLYASASRKTRFPTIKDRYSARFGTALPNPDLKPEQALHYELGWRGQPWTQAQAEVALFDSRVSNSIQDALVPSNQCGGTVCTQAQNVGKARDRGLEVSLQQRFAERGRLAVSYTWLDRDNLVNPVVPMINSPRHRLFAYAQWEFNPRWSALATAEAEHGRFVTYAGPGSVGGYKQIAGYATFGAKLVWSPREDVDVEAGARNIGNRWYELADGYPMPGRTWFTNVIFRF